MSVFGPPLPICQSLRIRVWGISVKRVVRLQSLRGGCYRDAAIHFVLGDITGRKGKAAARGGRPKGRQTRVFHLRS